MSEANPPASLSAKALASADGQNHLSIQDVAVIFRCSDGKQRAVQLLGRDRAKVIGYVKQLQGTVRLIATPMIVLELETAAALTTMVAETRRTPRHRFAWLTAPKLRARVCARFAKGLHSPFSPNCARGLISRLFPTSHRSPITDHAPAGGSQ